MKNPAAQSDPRVSRGGLGASGRFTRVGTRTLPYFWSAVAVGLAALVGLALTSQIRLPNVSMIFLLAVLFSAARFGMGPALFSSLLSFLAYNFFFIEPLHTFSVTEPHELLSLFVLLVAAILTSAIASRMRNEARRAAEKDRASRRLYKFARHLSRAADENAVARHGAMQIHHILRRSCVVYLVRDNALECVAVWPPQTVLDPETSSAAERLLRGEAPAGARQAADFGPWLWVRLNTSAGPVGIIGLASSEGDPLDAGASTLFETLAELIASALERARLGLAISSARLATETERLRNTFLASISHDFRTPLASILGAATSLIEYGAKLPESTRRDLLDQVKDEAEHLDGMVRNLLSLTRLEAGALELHRDWVDPKELLDRAVAAARRRGAVQIFRVEAEQAMPLVVADPMLLDQVLSNVIGNAVQHAGPGANITLSATRSGSEAVLSVTDNGPGIAPDVLPRIFDKFGKALTQVRDGSGTGLGLAIVKGIVAAHGGTVSATSPVSRGGGTRIEIRLPLPKDAP